MWRLADTAENNSKVQNAAIIKKMLLGLSAKVSFVKKIEVGVNIDESDAAYDLVLITEFENVEDLNRYKIHPDHVKVSEFVQKVRVARCVVDYEL